MKEYHSYPGSVLDDVLGSMASFKLLVVKFHIGSVSNDLIEAIKGLEAKVPRLASQKRLLLVPRGGYHEGEEDDFVSYFLLLCCLDKRY